MLFIILCFLFIPTCPAELTKDEIPIDYQLANKNDPKHLALGQVPRDKDIYIYAKIAAIEPMMIYESTLRGKGWAEPFINSFILELKKEKIPVYVDYFTTAKVEFYRTTSGYSMCSGKNMSVNNYKNKLAELKKNQYKYNDKFTLYSNINFISLPIGPMGISSKKRKLFEKHLWKNSLIYNILSILEDPSLYTIQITNQASMIAGNIYEDKKRIILDKYKKRVYDFVASNSIQVPLMLNANRMDYADLTYSGGDFYLKKLKIPDEKVKFAYASSVHPDLIEKDNYRVSLISCQGYKLDKLKKIINIINKMNDKTRTNFIFWEQVLQQFSKDMQIPYLSPLDFSGTKYNFIFKKEIDRGDFDFN